MHPNLSISMQSIKCVITGDGDVGKTCLSIRYATETFPVEYVATIFDNYTVNMLIDGHAVNLELWDTAGQDDFDNIRPISYPKTDICLVCFSLINRFSYNNVKEKWYPEVRRFAPQAPVILVGTKLDERENKKLRDGQRSVVTQADGLQLRDDISAIMYFECSAITDHGVRAIFEHAVRVVLDRRKRGEKQSKHCCVIS